MRKFTNADDLNRWLKEIITKTNEQSIPDIAREEYKDSKKYTYIDTGKMYSSGDDSDFEKGYVLIKAPQVRWLYYTSGIRAGAGNIQAVPQWHEATKRENMNKYKNIYINNFKKNKG